MPRLFHAFKSLLVMCHQGTSVTRLRLRLKPWQGSGRWHLFFSDSIHFVTSFHTCEMNCIRSSPITAISKRRTTKTSAQTATFNGFKFTMD